MGDCRSAVVLRSEHRHDVELRRRSDLRAFDVENGRELWKGELPASAHATPMTYRIGPAGRQYVVVAAGGHAKITEEKLSDALVAFAIRN
jgi:glucose dehydrogenase